MSRNPYLAASRPSSSFTRSSRTSKRNDLSTSSKGSLLGRSRSSAALGGLSSSSYSSAASYTPSTSAWQRSTSSNRLDRQGSDLSSSNTNYLSSSYKTADYTPSSSTSQYNRPSLYKSTSTHNLNSNDDATNDENKPNVLLYKNQTFFPNYYLIFDTVINLISFFSRNPTNL